MSIYLIYSFKDKATLESIFDKNKDSKLIYLKPRRYWMLWRIIAKSRIKSSDCVVCVMTQNFIYSRNIKWEIQCAENAGKRIYYYKVDKAIAVPQEILTSMIEINTINNLECVIKECYNKYLLSSLFNDDIPVLLVNKDEKDKLFEQYKIMVDSSNDLINRRYSLNKYYLTMNGALFSAAALMSRYIDKISNIKEGVLLIYFLLSVIGVFVNFVWFKQVRSYKQLNSGKFKVINMMELYLKAAIFTTEWKALADGKDKKIYESFTDNEIRIPKILVVIYIICGAIVLFTLYQGGVQYD